MENKSNKEAMKDKLFQALQQQGEELRSSGLQGLDVAEQLDVLIDTMHFLQDYDENVRVLNDYWLKKRQEEKFKKGEDR